MRIACWGYYGKQNLGDDLILAELCKNIRRYALKAQITVFSDAQSLEYAYQGGKVICCPRSAKELLRASMTHDILICGPGGLMPQRSTGKLLLWVALALIMKIRRRSLLFLGLGIGQKNFYHAIDRILFRLLTRWSCAFTVRQEGVNAALKTDGIQETADVVFAMETNEKHKRQEKMAVLSLANVFGNTAVEEQEKFLTGITEIVQDLTTQGYTVHFVEFTKGSDMYLYRQILGHLPATANVKVHPYNPDPYTVVELFQNAEICVCMRFHALVLAALTHTPCCAISYSDKMDDVARRLDLEEYIVKICPIGNLYYGRLISFDIQEFSNILKRLIEDKDAVREKLESNVLTLREKAQMNWNVLSDVIHLYNKKGE